eukprot:gnl/MRDRNA2_/MRDRNA2_36299_c0_seq1.p1 gnl/MRDRNA2_/MRDRNA2_36299_c0~~gnl/MRDRNA2_/MRDRNA2_36299_c0_seq1.p1  ORF type:complete len:453 (-),score=113.75 gnl/MRDRNA2_/MRDRNA2_36299_c0_seq1:115-1473(-)
MGALCAASVKKLESDPGPTIITNEQMESWAQSRGLVVYPPPPPVVYRPPPQLCRPVAPEELERLRQIFGKYDKDSSGTIDLKELQQMCKDLGGRMTDEEVANAMAQLDKDNNGTCDFEEFIHFWSSKPGLGGYHSITLDFLKMKMAGETAAERAGSALARANEVKGKGTSDCKLKGSIEVGPGMAECKEKMKIAVNLVKTDQADAAGHPALVVAFAGVDDAGASEVSAAFEKLIGKGLLPPILTASTSGTTIFIKSTEQPPPPNLAAGFSFVMAAMQKVELDITLGASFEDCLKTPEAPLLESLNGIKFAVDCIVSGDGKEFFTLNLPPHTQELARLFAGADAKLHLGYNSDRLQSGALGMIFGPLMMKLSDLRSMVEMQCSEQPPPEVLEIHAACKAIAKGVKHVDYVKIEKLPGGVELVAKFSQFNPFPMMQYVLEPLDRFENQAPAAEG